MPALRHPDLDPDRPGCPADGRSLVVWLPDDPGEHLIADFCSRSNVFCSADHLDAWLAGRPRHGQVVTVTDAADVGREAWSDVARPVRKWRGAAVTVIAADDERAVAVVIAIRAGDLDTLRRLLAAHPELATARIGSEGDCEWTRTLLHVATDWPGHYPNGPDVVRLLVAAGADPNGRFAGDHTETPLHWAASSDDVDVIDTLLDLAGDIDADGAVIAGGTPLTDAAAFGQWNAARRLLERGAHVGSWKQR